MPKLDIKKITKKREKIAAQLQELEVAEQAEYDRRATIAGHALLAQMEEDTTFAEQARQALDQRVKKNRDRALFDPPPRTRKSRTQTT